MIWTQNILIILLWPNQWEDITIIFLKRMQGQNYIFNIG